MVINLSEICADTDSEIKLADICLNPFQIIAINKRNYINSLASTGVVYGFEIHTPDKVYTINYMNKEIRNRRFKLLYDIWDNCMERVAHS